MYFTFIRTKNYSSEFIDGEVIEHEGTSVDTNLDYTPVRPGTVVIKANGSEIVDNGRGGFVGASGSIDYQSGAIKLTLGSAADDVVAEYYYDLENTESVIPQVDIKVEETIVTARPRKLKTQVYRVA